MCATTDFIYISDSNNQKIDVFSHSGEFKFNLGSNKNANLIKFQLINIQNFIIFKV